MSRHRFKGQTTGVHNVDLFERFLLGFENFRIRKIAKYCGWTRVSFSSLIGVQTRWSRKDVRGGVYLVQLYVNNEKMNVMTQLSYYLTNEGATTCKRYYVEIACRNLSYVQYWHSLVHTM